MENAERAKLRVDALNLAYGILLQQYQDSLGRPATTIVGAGPKGAPTTEQVLAEATKLSKFVEGQ